MLVSVLNKHGNPLMPCSPVNARILFKRGKAKVIKRTPLTIQLLHGSSGYRQPITLGVDSGYVHIGLSAVTAKKEVYAADVQLRENIVRLNSERRMYRRNRCNRKTWYRQPRFLNRKKPEGWLAPSIQHNLDSHIKLIEKVKAIIPVARSPSRLQRLISKDRGSFNLRYRLPEWAAKELCQHQGVCALPGWAYWSNL